MSELVAIPPEDLVTDSDSSSSENESLTSSSSDDDAGHGSEGKAADGDPITRDTCTSRRPFFTTRRRDPPVPRRVERLREAVFEALICAFHILDMREVQLSPPTSAGGSAGRARGESSRPVPAQPGRALDYWARIVQRLPDISTGLGAFHSDLPMPIVKVLGECDEHERGPRRVTDGPALLIVVLDEDLVALPADKIYLRRDLNKLEAGAARTFGKRWSVWRSDIVSLFNLDEPSDPASSKHLLDLRAARAIRPVHRPFVVRVVHCALQLDPHPRKLSLSGIPGMSMEAWQATDFACLMETLGLDASVVQHLSLAWNGFKRESHAPSSESSGLVDFRSGLPDWRPWPFPALETLDLTSNPLEAVPIGLLKVRRLRRVMTDEDHDSAAAKIKSVVECSFSWADCTERQQPPRRSLTEHCVSVLMQYETMPDELDTLPPGLAEYVRSAYRCDLCRTPCIPGSGKRESDQSLWLSKEVVVTWRFHVGDRLPHSIIPSETKRHMRVQGRVCRVCRQRLL